MRFRESIQTILVIICFIIFKRTANFALQLTLFIILNAVVIQEFLHIYNNERNSKKANENFKESSVGIWQLVGIIMLEIFVILTVYYLSTILLKNFKN